MTPVVFERLRPRGRSRSRSSGIFAGERKEPAPDSRGRPRGRFGPGVGGNNIVLFFGTDFLDLLPFFVQSFIIKPASSKQQLPTYIEKCYFVYGAVGADPGPGAGPGVGP